MAGPDVFGTNPYLDNRPVDGELVTLLRGVTGARNLALEDYRSRAVIAGQVHELMTTDQPEAGPGATVDRVALIGFFEVMNSGVLLVGSEVVIESQSIGVVAGFNDTHMPNHQNICVRVDELHDGASLDLAVGGTVRFRAAGEERRQC